MMTRLGAVVLVMAGLTCVCNPVQGVTVTNNPTADAMLRESEGPNNFGVTPWLCVKGAENNGHVALARFSLSAHADDFARPGFKLTKATLRFMVWDDGVAGAYTCSIDALHEDNDDWVEGTSDWPVESGAACWDYRAHNTDAWAGGASGALAAVDRRTDWGAIGQFTVQPLGGGVGQICEAEIAEVFDDGTTREDLFRSWAGLAGAYGTDGVNPGFVIHNTRNGSTYVLSREETAQSGSLPELAFEYSFPKGTVVAVR